MIKQSSAPAEKKALLSLEGLANFLRENCEGFNEDGYTHMYRSAQEQVVTTGLVTKYLQLAFDLTPTKNIGPDIEVLGNPNYDCTLIRHDITWSGVAQKLSEKYRIKFRNGAFYSSSSCESIIFLERAIKDVEKAQRELNISIEEEINRILQL